MNRFLFVSIVNLLFVSCTTQHSQVWKEIENVYGSLSGRVQHVYISDTIYQTYPFTFSDVKYLVEPTDTQLLKEILESGREKKIKYAEIRSHLPNARFISLENFRSIESEPPNLTLDEERTLSSLDSVERLRTIELLERDSVAYMQLSQLQEKISKSENFKSYWKKLEYNDKRLLVVYPLHEYKNNILLTIANYKSRTNSELIVKIVNTDKAN